jgi:hypothetical protein
MLISHAQGINLSYLYNGVSTTILLAFGSIQREINLYVQACFWLKAAGIVRTFVNTLIIYILHSLSVLRKPSAQMVIEPFQVVFAITGSTCPVTPD